MGNIGLDEDGVIIFASQFFWPCGMKSSYDKQGKFFGNKTATLEMIGLVIPFLCCPELLAGKHVVFQVDNISCYFGWKNKVVAGDKTASILIRALVILSSYLCCYVHVSHLPRLSSWEACICDNLSREKSTRTQDKKLVDSFGHLCPKIFLNWLDNPNEDWELVDRLLSFVEEKYIEG